MNEATRVPHDAAFHAASADPHRDSTQRRYVQLRAVPESDNFRSMCALELPDPRVQMWRENEACYVRISATHMSVPVRGRFTMWWACNDTHPFWVALLDGTSLEANQKRDIDTEDVLTAAARVRILASSEASSSPPQ